MTPDFNNNRPVDGYLETLIVSKARVLFMKFGVKSITMDDVVAECGISKKTLYKHFDRDLLVAAVTQQLLDVYRARLASIRAKDLPVIEEMRNMLLNFLTSAAELSVQFLSSLQAYNPTAFEKLNVFTDTVVEHVLVDNLERGKLQGLYRSEVVSEIVFKLYMGNVHEIMHQQVPARSPAWIEEMNRHFLFGLLSVKGREWVNDRQLEI